MSYTVYTVGHIALQLPVGLDDPYPPAILNSILMETDMVENILVASLAEQYYLLNNFYHYGEMWTLVGNGTGYRHGLPKIQTNAFTSVSTFVLRPVLHNLHSNITVDESNVKISDARYVLAHDLDPEVIAAADFIQSGLGFQDGSGGIGFHEDLQNFNPNRNHMTTSPPEVPVQKWHRFYSVTSNDLGSYYIFDVDYPQNDIESPDPYHYKWQLWDIADDGNGTITRTKIDSGTRDVTIINKESPGTLFIQTQWHGSGYEEENVYDILKVSDYPSLEPAMPLEHKGYPIIPLRQNKLWYDVYYGYDASLVTNIETAWKKLSLGLLSDLKRAFQELVVDANGEPVLDANGNKQYTDKDDLHQVGGIYMTTGSDLYHPDTLEYSFNYFYDLLYESVARYSTFTYPGDYKYIHINDEHILFDMYLILAKIEYVFYNSIPPFTETFTEKDIKYQLTWEENPDIPNGTPPWMGESVPNENDPGIHWEPGATYFVPDTVKQMLTCSNRVVVITKFNGITNETFSKVKIHGLVQIHKIKVGDKKKVTQNIPDPDQMNLRRAEIAELKKGNVYEGDKGYPFMLPLRKETIDNLTRHSKMKVLNNGLFMNIYISDIDHQSWWVHYRADLLSLVEQFIWVVSLLMMADGGFSAWAAKGLMGVLRYAGADYLKKAIVNALISEIGAGNTMALEFAYRIYKGDFKGLDLNKWNELTRDFLYELSQIVITYEIEFKYATIEKELAALDKDSTEYEEEDVEISNATGKAFAKEAKVVSYKDIKHEVLNAGKPPDIVLEGLELNQKFYEDIDKLMGED